MSSKALQQPLGIKLLSTGFLAFWCLLAAFPIFWIFVMSVKMPIDSFDGNFWHVVFGPNTLANGKGLSIFDIFVYLLSFWVLYRLGKSYLPQLVKTYLGVLPIALAWVFVAMAFAIFASLLFIVVFPAILAPIDARIGFLGTPIIGFTTEHYRAIWIEKGFSQNFWNSMKVTFGVVTVSLTVGTLAGYALARSNTSLAMWILVIALIFRALPHSVLVTGYLPFFINSAEILRPILGENAPTLYGQPWAVIAVLVSINQPFTIWMLNSFFQSIPEELDEAARVDGCTHSQAFRWVIMPVMWPGVITTGLFSFLLAYNDYLVCSLLLDAQNQTMVPAITGFFNRETTTTDQVEAVAAAVSITAPLLILVMIFQRQIVSGLTAGAVKG